MTTYKTFAAAASAVLLTLVTAGSMPALAASQDDQQAPRGQDTQAPATNDDVQAPRSARF